ncbi:MAG TPA: hypothetical protein VIR64_01635, partial [Pseudobacillus sp.]
FDTALEPLEKAQLFGHLFPAAVLYHDRLVLQTNIQGAPVDVSVPISDDPYPWHNTKKKKQAK